MKNKRFWLRLVAVAALQSALFAPGLAAAADHEPGADAECRRNPPGLRVSDMISAGYVVHELEDGSYTYVRLDYVFPDSLYYRYQGNTWRTLYLAHPSSVIQKPHSRQPVICGYVIGFRIDQRGSEESKPRWVFIQDIDFLETP